MRATSLTQRIAGGQRLGLQPSSPLQRLAQPWSAAAAVPGRVPQSRRFLAVQAAKDKHSSGHAPKASSSSSSQSSSGATTLTADRGYVGAETKQNRIPGLAKTAWGQSLLEQQYPQLNEDLLVDVCVVGAGIAGLSTAYNLVKAGKSVAVLEYRVVGAGQTGRTTAHIMMWNDDYYFQLEGLVGQSGASQVANSHTEAVAFVKKVVEEEGIDCGFKLVDGYLFPSGDDPKGSSEKLKKELAAARRAGVPGVEQVELDGSSRVGGIREALKFPGCGDFQPLKYIQGLAKAVQKHGGAIYEGTRVHTADDGVVKVEGGRRVRAREGVVLATDGPINQNLLVHGRQQPYRSYVVAMEVEEGAVEEAQYWSTEEPYHYVRLTKTPEDKLVMIVGGEDHLAGIDPDEYYDAYARLEAWAKARWGPALGETVYRWTGLVLEPADMLGLYGKDPTNLSRVPHYIATGHSGQGMTGGTIGGLVISDLILNGKSSWEDVYSPARLASAVKSAPTLLEEAANIGSNYAKRFAIRDGKDVKGLVVPSLAEAELGPGEGAVFQEGLQKVAVYNDGMGNKHKRSAICPHLGCMVQWNPNDRTFDCQCHGSIFDTHGRVINGPAHKDLEVLD